MPHGDLSDMTAYFCAATGFASMLKPELWYASAGPLKPMFDAPATPETLAAIRFAGGLLGGFMFLTLFIVRWNTVNGKAGALGCLIAAGNAVSIALAMDDRAFVLRGWYVLALVFVLAALHLAFNANPMLTSEMLREKEARRAAKAKAKAR